ncbi:hypothetical protein [Azospirillum sp. TSO5]|uniref:hypothetical protein n=1 Tax=Azospirillum sp. TSO5 TaxID=716760 RepID=UPI000D60DD8D|nr:hypothetical protein [Azospirillum sp. TSO5]PWC92979.1 hypothetical protein TSO5_16260 [Azospirillum sp. TSO5]
MTTGEQVFGAGGAAGAMTASVGLPPDGRREAWRRGLFLAVTGLVSAVYVFFELAYNGTLLAVSSDPSAGNDVLTALSWVGQILLAFGLAWYFGSGLVRTLRGASGFLVLWVCTLAAVHYGYHSALDGLPPDVKDAGRVVALHRADVLAGRAEDGFLAPGGKPDPVAAVSSALLLADDAAAARAAARDAERAEKARKDIDFGAERLRTSHARVWSDLKALHRDYQFWSLEVSRPKERRGGAVAMAGDRLDREFAQRTGGLPANPDASLGQFAYEILPQSSDPKARKLVEAFFRKSIPMADGRRLALSDLPYGMDSAKLDVWIEAELVSPWRAAAGSDPEAWARAEGSHNVVASVFVPPVSMVLSQVSILLNVSKILASLWAIWGLAAGGRGGLLPASATAAVCLGAVVWTAAPPSAFPAGSEAARVEASAKASLGLWGEAWSKGAAVQRLMSDSGIGVDLNVAREAIRVWKGR